MPERERSPGERRPFRLADRARSFVHAFRGIAILVSEEHNAWIHAAATLAVLVLGVLLDVSRLEWALLALAIGLVWSAEALNTAIEWLCDVASPEHHPLVAKAKDVAAAGVLLAALAAAAAGACVFVPRLLALLASAAARTG
jgi:diacylglycerol kinase (ATP)